MTLTWHEDGASSPLQTWQLAAGEDRVLHFEPEDPVDIEGRIHRFLISRTPNDGPLVDVEAEAADDQGEFDVPLAADETFTIHPTNRYWFEVRDITDGGNRLRAHGWVSITANPLAQGDAPNLATYRPSWADILGKPAAIAAIAALTLTPLGQALLQILTPVAARYLRFNADGSVTLLDAETLLDELGGATADHNHTIADVSGLQDELDAKTTPAAVAAQIAALVASAPAALDTLNELAAALGNDPNFATTITNLMAAKAPSASPALTGTPTAPTAAIGTNTTQLATTAFVRGEIAAVSGLSSDASITNSTTFTDSGLAVSVVSGAQYAIDGFLRFEGVDALWSFKTRLNGVAMTTINVEAERRVYDNASTMPVAVGINGESDSGGAVTAVSTGTKTFTVAPNSFYTIQYATLLIVSGSTGNDGTYTVANVTRNSDFTYDIEVQEAIPSAVADGDVAVECGAAITMVSRIASINTTLAVFKRNISTGVNVAFRGQILPSASGALKVQFAQNTLDASFATVLKRGSWIRIARQN